MVSTLVILICFAALGLALLALLCYACAVPSSQVLGPALVRGPASGNRVVLTFDDGPADPYTGRILDCLHHYQVPATFFVCGKNVERYPDLVRRICAEKHTLGNHTFTHPFLYFKNHSRMLAEIDGTQAAVERVTGRKPEIFRPPYGARWFGLFDILRERGLAAVQWSDPSFDWVTKNQPGEIARTTLRHLRGGGVILMHDGREPRRPEDVDASSTVAALPAIIEGARRAGLEFVPIEDFL